MHSDALLGFKGFQQSGRSHGKHSQTENPILRDTLFKWANTIMDNLKRYLLGIYHAIRENRRQSTLYGFIGRFNHRYDLKQAFFDAIKCVQQAAPKIANLIQHGGSR